MDVILEGVVGSTAYGLATADSDIDLLGVWQAPLVDLVGLSPPVGKSASVVSHKPDRTLHELGKFVTLALGANPTVTEALWLDRIHGGTLFRCLPIITSARKPSKASGLAPGLTRWRQRALSWTT